MVIRPFPDVDPGEPIFGYTFQQPYGSAVIDADKRDENRPKPPPSRFQGRAFWIAVHAGATFYSEVERADFTSTSLLRLDAQGRRRPPLWPDCPEFHTFPKRVVLGAARVVGALEYRAGDSRLGAWAFGPWVWLLDRTVIKLPTPKPLRMGALGLWTLAPSLDARPERCSEADWRNHLAECAEVLRALRVAKADPTCWRRAG